MKEQDELICVCAEIYLSTIVAAIRDKGLDTVEAIGDETGAGTHCGGCQERIVVLPVLIAICLINGKVE